MDEDKKHWIVRTTTHWSSMYSIICETCLSA